MADFTAMTPLRNSARIKFTFVFIVTIALAAILTLIVFRTIKAQENSRKKYHSISLLADILSSHWDINTRIIDFGKYHKGDIENYDTIFLIIENYDQKIPDSLLQDILNSTHQEVVWAGYGSEVLLSLLQDPGKAAHFDSKQISSVEYKGRQFQIEPWQISNPPVFPSMDGIEVLAYTVDGQKKRVPFIADIKDRYLILPINLGFYYAIDNVSLVFLDVLHRSFGHHRAQKTALLRLEDVSPIDGLDLRPLEATS